MIWDVAGVGDARRMSSTGHDWGCRPYLRGRREETGHVAVRGAASTGSPVNTRWVSVVDAAPDAAVSTHACQKPLSACSSSSSFVKCWFIILSFDFFLSALDLLMWCGDVNTASETASAGSGLIASTSFDWQGHRCLFDGANMTPIWPGRAVDLQGYAGDWWCKWVATWRETLKVDADLCKNGIKRIERFGGEQGQWNYRCKWADN